MKNLVVAKFGGSSLCDSGKFRQVRDIVSEDPRRRIIVPSAPGKRHQGDHKVTDLLSMSYQLASHGLPYEDVFALVAERFHGITKDLALNTPLEELLQEIRRALSRGASRDYCISRGEYLSGRILADYLQGIFVDPGEIIRFQERGGVDEAATLHLIRQHLQGEGCYIVPGFYGALADGAVKTFSRGGSDITGAILADGLEAELYENWTDVSGFLQADPRIVRHPRPIRAVTYQELRELSYMGAPVLHEDAIFPVKRRGIPIQIRNTDAPEDPGTLIVKEGMEKHTEDILTGISGKKDFTVITVEKTMMSADSTFLRKLVTVFEANEVTILHMPSSIDSISVIVSEKELNGKLRKIQEELRIYLCPDAISTYRNMALLAVVGYGMIRKKGVAAKVFTALYQGGVNIRMITQGASEMNILIGLENADFEKAVRAIYSAFHPGEETGPPGEEAQAAQGTDRREGGGSP